MSTAKIGRIDYFAALQMKSKIIGIDANILNGGNVMNEQQIEEKALEILGEMKEEDITYEDIRKIINEMLLHV